MKSFISVVLLFFSSYCSAQYLGLKAGLSRATIQERYTKSDSVVSNPYGNGSYVSFSYEKQHAHKKWIHSVVEIGYQQKAAVKTFDTTQINLKPRYEGQINYLVIQPQVKLFYSYKSWAAYALAGARLDYRLSVRTDPDSIGVLIKKYVEDNFNPIMVGFSYGVGITKELPHVRLGLEFQRQEDFFDLLYQDPPGIRLHANAYAFLASIAIPLEKKKEAE